jgi:hypothetical protein
MTEKVKEIIATTKTYNSNKIHDFIFMSDGKTQFDEWVSKPDFARIVTELCDEIEALKKANEWISVEGRLPEPITSIQMRKKNGYIGVGYMSAAMHQFYDYKSQTYFEISDVIEWKPIN